MSKLSTGNKYDIKLYIMIVDMEAFKEEYRVISGRYAIKKLNEGNVYLIKNKSQYDWSPTVLTRLCENIR